MVFFQTLSYFPVTGQQLLRYGVWLPGTFSLTRLYNMKPQAKLPLTPITMLLQVSGVMVYIPTFRFALNYQYCLVTQQVPTL